MLMWCAVVAAQACSNSPVSPASAADSGLVGHAGCTAWSSSSSNSSSAGHLCQPASCLDLSRCSGQPRVGCLVLGLGLWHLQVAGQVPCAAVLSSRAGMGPEQGSCQAGRTCPAAACRAAAGSGGCAVPGFYFVCLLGRSSNWGVWGHCKEPSEADTSVSQCDGVPGVPSFAEGVQRSRFHSSVQGPTQVTHDATARMVCSSMVSASFHTAHAAALCDVAWTSSRLGSGRGASLAGQCAPGLFAVNVVSEVLLLPTVQNVFNHWVASCSASHWGSQHTWPTHCVSTADAVCWYRHSLTIGSTENTYCSMLNLGMCAVPSPPGWLRCVGQVPSWLGAVMAETSSK